VIQLCSKISTRWPLSRSNPKYAVVT